VISMLMEGYRVPVHLTYLGNVLGMTLNITRCLILGILRISCSTD